MFLNFIHVGEWNNSSLYLISRYAIVKIFNDSSIHFPIGGILISICLGKYLGMEMVNMKNCQTGFQSDCAILQYSLQGVRGIFALHPHQYLLFSSLFLNISHFYTYELVLLFLICLFICLLAVV